MPSPVVPMDKTPSIRASCRKPMYESNASRSSSLPLLRSGVSAAAIVLAIAAMLVGASSAAASEPLSNTNVKDARLAVGAKGEALVTYRTEAGSLRHVLIWGAINARTPDPTLPQVRFKYDYSGGWKSRHNLNYWKTIKSCRPYDGPELQLVVAACDAPDGSYWALQAWQRALPLLGFHP